MKLWNRAIAGLLLAWACSAGADPLPRELAGVWANDDAVLRGAALMKGQAVYIGADGTGAIIGGPPPIGFKITVVFFEQSGELEITAHEGLQSGIVGRMKYNARNNTLSSLDGVLLHRRFDELTEEMRRSIGLPVR